MLRERAIHQYDFWLELNTWSHVVIVVDVRRVVTSMVQVYVSGWPTDITASTTPLPDHPFAMAAVTSQLTIAVRGTYDMDDLWLALGIKLPHMFYGNKNKIYYYVK